jgi:alkylhydroperoxidase/carboxymuconolactone decarboxylase family protein YurZ
MLSAGRRNTVVKDALYRKGMKTHVRAALNTGCTKAEMAGTKVR